LWNRSSLTISDASMQLSMPIRSRLSTLTTCSYPCSRSLTNEHSSSSVSGSTVEGEEWVRGVGRLIVVCNYPFASRFAVNNIFHCRVLKYMESRVAFTCCSKWNRANGRALLTKRTASCVVCDQMDPRCSEVPSRCETSGIDSSRIDKRACSRVVWGCSAMSS